MFGNSGVPTFLAIIIKVGSTWLLCKLLIYSLFFFKYFYEKHIEQAEKEVQIFERVYTHTQMYHEVPEKYEEPLSAGKMKVELKWHYLEGSSIKVSHVGANVEKKITSNATCTLQKVNVCCHVYYFS